MNIRNVLIVTGLFLYCMSTHATIIVRNQYKKPIVLRLDGKELPSFIPTGGTYTLPTPLPNKIEVKSEGGIRFHGGIQKELDEVRQSPNAVITVLDTSNALFFDYDTSTVSRPATPETQLKNDQISSEKYLEIVENNPQKYGAQTANEIRQLREHFERQSNAYKNTLTQYKNHPYQLAKRNVNRYSSDFKGESDAWLLNRAKQDINTAYLLLPGYIKENKQKYGLND